MYAEAFLTLNLLYLGAMLPIAVLIFLIFRFGLRMKEWYRLDLIAVLAPGVLYWLLDESVNRGKTLANLVEPIWIGFLCGGIFLVRCVIARRYPDRSRRISLYALGAMVLVTVAVYLFTPGLPE